MDNLTKKRNVEDETSEHLLTLHPSKKSSSDSSSEQAAKVVANSMSSQIFQLPREIFHHIFTNYLSFQDLAKFDSLLLSRVDRFMYHSLIENMTFKTLQPVKNIFQLKWLFCRKVRLDRVDIFAGIDDNHFLDLYPLQWSSIKEIIFSDGIFLHSGSILKCLAKCTSLEELSFATEENLKDTGIDDVYVSTVVQVFDQPEFCANLRKISFGRFSCFTDEILLLLSEHCSNLVSIQFDPTDVDSDVLLEFFAYCGSNFEILRWCNHGKYNFFSGADDADLSDYLEYCPELKEIPNILNNYELIAAGQYCPNLTKVTIGFDFETGNFGLMLYLNGSDINECRYATYRCSLPQLGNAITVRSSSHRNN